MRLIGMLLCIGMISISAQVQAQYLLLLSEEDCVELSVDIIRKGIQQADVDRIMRVVGKSVTIRSYGSKTRNEVARDFKRIFAESLRKAGNSAAQTAAEMESTHCHSYFQNFDILLSKITIRGDSAYVSCELVCWSTPMGDGPQAGTRTSEQFVLLTSGNEHPERPSSRDPLRWQLVRCNYLLEFLSKIKQQSSDDNSRKAGEK